MPKIAFVYVLALGLVAPSFAAAQEREFSKNYIDVKTATWRGLILERSCFQKLGREKAAAADHTACALECLKKGQALGILTDDDGFMNIVGRMAEDNFAKLTQFIGKRVEVTGTSALPTGNYIPRQLDMTGIVAEKN
jgi:hypothetical protein